VILARFAWQDDHIQAKEGRRGRSSQQWAGVGEEGPEAPARGRAAVGRGQQRRQAAGGGRGGPQGARVGHR